MGFYVSTICIEHFVRTMTVVRTLFALLVCAEAIEEGWDCTYYYQDTGHGKWSCEPDGKGNFWWCDTGCWNNIGPHFCNCECICEDDPLKSNTTGVDFAQRSSIT